MSGSQYANMEWKGNIAKLNRCSFSKTKEIFKCTHAHTYTYEKQCWKTMYAFEKICMLNCDHVKVLFFYSCVPRSNSITATAAELMN